RLIHYGFVGGPNLFAQIENDLGKTSGIEWRLYGGHRLWHAPEHPIRTYYPDNAPVEIIEEGDTVRVIQPTESISHIQKEMRLSFQNGAFHVEHRLTNQVIWPVELAIWAVTALGDHGVAIVPLPPRGTHAEHLQPTNTLTLWAYTDLSDPRCVWGREFILVRQEPDNETPQKFGVRTPHAWAGCVVQNTLFLKQFDYRPQSSYPDFDCNVEVYTDHRMIEVESLGPLVNLPPNQTITHHETWNLIPDVPAPSNEEEVMEAIMPKIDALRA
ncbi:MAG: hypothetical protein GYB68_12235, partial [Chloroflexi bacterium]|nr:hypothetical protein [Chloroflexota bacterium]